MVNAYGWSVPTPDSAAVGGFRADVASVARMWVAAAYDDLRRAGPDRARQVRRLIDGYLLPWFAPQTDTVGDITYFMVHEWLLTLVGRRSSSQPGQSDPATPVLTEVGEYRELSLRETAVAAKVSVATVRRRWRDGELVGAYRDSGGQVRIPEATGAAVRKKGALRPAGLSQTVVADALWVLRRVLGFARANGMVPAGFDPTEGLDAPRPDPAVALARCPASQPRPLSFPECARIAAHLHPIHQLVLWLQRVMGLRISEAFGLLVDDIVDLGDTGLLLVRGQGGRLFHVRDDYGRVVKVSHKESTKTDASARVLVVPPVMMELLRVALDAFHTDPDSGDVEETARLVPGLRRGDESGQLSFREAFESAAAGEGLGHSDLGFPVSPHLLRKSVATDLAWQSGIEDAVRRRFMGHRAADDVYGRVYTLDHPELTPLEQVASILEEIIRASIGSLLVATTRRIRWGHSNRHLGRAAHVDATLGAAGWMIDPDSVDDPLCDTGRVAVELRIAQTTARRWMRDGTLKCVIVADGDGIERRWARLSEVWSLRARLRERILLPNLAEDLGVRYHELYQTCRRLGVELDRHPTSRQFEISPEAVRLLRDEHARVRALHQRSMKMAAASARLNLAVSTIRLMAKRGQLDVDPETDGSGARFVTRASVERWVEPADLSQQKAPGVEAVALADVIRFTGRSGAEVRDLVQAGVVEEVPGRRRCELTAASLRAWMTTGA